MRKACRSVLATTNSMPSIPASIMRFTALLPPPPTPITLILASLRVSSLKLMRMPFSFFMSAAIIEFLCSLGLVFLSCFDLFLRFMGKPLYSTAEGVPFPLSALICEQCFQSSTPTVILHATRGSSAVPVGNHSQGRRKFRFGQRGRHLRHRHWPSQPHRATQHRFRNVENPGQARSASAEHDSANAALEHAVVTEIFAHHFEQLTGPGLEDLGHESLRQQTRRPVAYRRNLYLIAFGDQRCAHIAVKLLKFFGLCDRGTHADRQVTGKVIASDRNDSG